LTQGSTVKMGNSVLQIQKAEQLKLEQEREKTSEFNKILNYQITELFNDVIEKVNAINERLEDSKIKIDQRGPIQGSTARKLTVSFGSKSVTFEITESTLLEQYENEIKRKSLEFQRHQYGMLLQIPEDSFLRANKVILIGLAETNFRFGTSEFGFNLLLRKIDDSNYGEWHMMQFIVDPVFRTVI